MILGSTGACPIMHGRPSCAADEPLNSGFDVGMSILVMSMWTRLDVFNMLNLKDFVVSISVYMATEWAAVS